MNVSKMMEEKRNKQLQEVLKDLKIPQVLPDEASKGKKK